VESNLSLRVAAHVAATARLCQVVYMAEVVVFGAVAADVVLRVQRIPASGDHVNAEALGWRIGGSSANVAGGLSMAGHHVRLVGPVGSDSMGDDLLTELEQCGVDTEYTFRADVASPRTLILLDGTGERTIIAVDSEAGPSSFLPERVPDLGSADCVYVEGYTRYPADTAAAAGSAFTVLIGLVLVVASLGVFSGTAVAAPHGLDKDPRRIDFGQVTSATIAVRTVTITNNTGGFLAGGTFELITENFGAHEVFSVEPGTTGNCNVGDAPVQGDTVSLAPGESCTFDVSITGFGLPAGRYDGRLDATFGNRTVRVPLDAQKVGP
jgi:pfkB family carbohydrate kinase